MQNRRSFIKTTLAGIGLTALPATAIAAIPKKPKRTIVVKGVKSEDFTKADIKLLSKWKEGVGVHFITP